jgi:hypothetical protein
MANVIAISLFPVVLIFLLPVDLPDGSITKILLACGPGITKTVRQYLVVQPYTAGSVLLLAGATM